MMCSTAVILCVLRPSNNEFFNIKAHALCRYEIGSAKEIENDLSLCLRLKVLYVNVPIPLIEVKIAAMPFYFSALEVDSLRAREFLCRVKLL